VSCAAAMLKGAKSARPSALLFERARISKLLTLANFSTRADVSRFVRLRKHRSVLEMVGVASEKKKRSPGPEKCGETQSAGPCGIAERRRRHSSSAGRLFLLRVPLRCYPPPRPSQQQQRQRQQQQEKQAWPSFRTLPKLVSGQYYCFFSDCVPTPMLLRPEDLTARGAPSALGCIDADCSDQRFI
jgi:hypothetical protein